MIFNTFEPMKPHKPVIIDQPQKEASGSTASGKKTGRERYRVDFALEIL